MILFASSLTPGRSALDFAISAISIALSRCGTIPATIPVGRTGTLGQVNGPASGDFDPNQLVPESARSLGPSDALVTLVEFGDFGCPYCAAASTPVLKLALRLEDVRVVWRHFPDRELHQGADLAAEASEAAAEQGSFWPYHDRLLAHQGAFDAELLDDLAVDLDLDTDGFRAALAERRFRQTVEADVRDGRKLGVTGTPTFFIDGQRVEGPWAGLRDLLPAAVSRAR